MMTVRRKQCVFAAIVLVCIWLVEGIRFPGHRVMKHVKNNLFASTIVDVAPEQQRKVESPIVVGGGPAGLASAIMLARRGYRGIKVFDKLSEPPTPNDTSVWGDFDNERSYSIGISGRGQNALSALDVLQGIEDYSTICVGRKDWAPESKVDEPVETISVRSYVPRIIQRDRLTSCLLQEIRQKYSDSISVKFNVECKSAKWITSSGNSNSNKAALDGDETCVLKFSDTNGDVGAVQFEEKSQFVIGADGAQSAVRDAMEKDQYKGFFVKRYEDKNVRVYRTIPLHFPKDGKEAKKWRRDLNYSARTKSDINIDALPTKEGPYFGVVLYRPWDTRLKDLKTAADARAFFDQVLPMFSPVVRDADLEKFAKKADSKLPRFMYTGPVLHRGATTCLVGDCIHTVKPYFGVGLNSALEDVISLNTALDACKDNVPAALAKYSSLRAKDTEAIVQMSVKFDGGFFSFVFPLIVDSIMHKTLPFLFSPNSLAAIQNPKLRYSQIRRRKRFDRVLQFALLGSALAGVAKAVLVALSFFKSLLPIVKAKLPFFA